MAGGWQCGGQTWRDGIGMLLGLSLGISLGSVFDQVGTGVALGLLGGVALDAAAQRRGRPPGPAGDAPSSS